MNLQIHKCAVTACHEQIPKAKLMCRIHWSQVPPTMQKAINDAWSAVRMARVKGNPAHKPLEDYQAARSQAIAFFAEKKTDVS